MFDSSAIFTNGLVISGNGNSTAVQVKKTPPEGLEIAIVCTAKSGTSPTVDAVLYDSDDDSSYSAIYTFPQITAVGIKRARIQSKKQYFRLAYVLGGSNTPLMTLTAGVVSGQQRDTYA